MKSFCHKLLKHVYVEPEELQQRWVYRPDTTVKRVSNTKLCYSGLTVFILVDGIQARRRTALLNCSLQSDRVKKYMCAEG